ncbi:hypothetical protein HW555_008746 [Spodoptera exigua]|uniref:Uncharacterized protein n=1 Tax=Spodoptera exigua TaxID=7107 RepID=A0A835L7H8_SPOEX|nr:hypothetical protein HW555_008746 [Spodoptera exigua]
MESASVTDRLNKLREERIAREKARIAKLRELNLKKYNKNDDIKNSNSNLSIVNKSVKSESNMKNNGAGPVKNYLHVNGAAKRPLSVPTKIKNEDTKSKLDLPKSTSNIPKITNKTEKIMSNIVNVNKKVGITNNNKKPVNNTESKFSKTDKKQVLDSKPQVPRVSLLQKPKLNTNADRKQNFPIRKAEGLTSNVKIRQSLAVANNKPPSHVPRKSMIPQSSSNSESVFDRLYKPKPVQNSHKNEIEKLQTDPNYLKKVIRTSGLILNKRHTVFEPAKAKVAVPVRRSISAVHFKRIGKQELGNCIHKWSSIGDKLNNIHLKHINEDENVREEKVVSAVKSERKKVTFMTPMGNFNTPRPEELQARLKSWLQKRGKSLDSYHHLQCFGIHHLPQTIKFDPKAFDEENKENIAVESDSDDDSFTENMNEDPKASTGEMEEC